MSIGRHRSADDALASKPWSAILLVKCNLQDLIQFSSPVEPTDGRGAGGKGRRARSRNGALCGCPPDHPRFFPKPSPTCCRRCGDATVPLVDLCGSAKTAVPRGEPT